MKYIALILLSFINSLSFSQNLVENPSFEQIEINSTKSSFLLNSVADWVCPGKEAYHFHQNLKDNGYLGPLKFHKTALKLGYSVPYNFLGTQHPHSGDAYIAMGTQGYKINEKIKYKYYNFGVYGKLKEPLKRNKLYYAEFYISRADRYPVKFSSIWLSFSDTIYKYEMHDSGNIKKYYTNPQGNYITEYKNWQKISGSFFAAGGEKYIYIGASPEKSELTAQNSYYFYIDDVLVKEIKDSLVIEPNKPLILKNITFTAGKSELLTKSFPELEKLLNYMLLHPKINIEISGHTDNVGNKDKNIILSKDRADSVKNYLVDNGITGNRLSCKGFGDKKPVKSNSTPEGKAYNRRVEIKIVQ